MDTDKTNNERPSWDVLGHEDIVSYFRLAISEDKLSHAYLFHGPKRVGKWHLAQILAQALRCSNLEQGNPCKGCTNCIQIVKDGHSEVFTIERPEDKQVISIDQIRELQHSLTMRSFLDTNRVILINEAQRLTEEAGNALLKTLEEPPQKTIFIIITENKNGVLQTIVSRSTPIHFSLVSTPKIASWMKKIGSTPQLARILSHAALGRPGVAIRLFQNQGMHERRKNSIELLTQLVKASVSEKMFLISAILKSTSKETMVNDLQQILDDWVTFFRDILLTHAGVKQLANVSYKDTLTQLTTTYTQTRTIDSINAIASVKKRLQQSINPTLLLENLALVL